MILAIVLNKFNILILIITALAIFISVIPAIKFQKEQKKKYSECMKLIKEKENGSLDNSNAVNINQISKIDSSVDIDKLMMLLYSIYLEFIEKLNKNDKDFNGILDGFVKEFYENKIDIYENKNYLEITDNIELVNYSIIEYEKEKIKFRINITCFNYKICNKEIISGSNLERVSQIFLVTYIKSKKKWVITNIEKVFEKKLSI